MRRNRGSLLKRRKIISAGSGSALLRQSELRVYEGGKIQVTLNLDLLGFVVHEFSSELQPGLKKGDVILAVGCTALVRIPSDADDESANQTKAKLREALGTTVTCKRVILGTYDILQRYDLESVQKAVMEFVQDAGNPATAPSFSGEDPTASGKVAPERNMATAEETSSPAVFQGEAEIDDDMPLTTLVKMPRKTQNAQTVSGGTDTAQLVRQGLSEEDQKFWSLQKKPSKPKPQKSALAKSLFAKRGAEPSPVKQILTPPSETMLAFLANPELQRQSKMKKGHLSGDGHQANPADASSKIASRDAVLPQHPCEEELLDIEFADAVLGTSKDSRCTGVEANSGVQDMERKEERRSDDTVIEENQSKAILPQAQPGSTCRGDTDVRDIKRKDEQGSDGTLFGEIQSKNALPLTQLESRSVGVVAQADVRDMESKGARMSGGTLEEQSRTALPQTPPESTGTSVIVQTNGRDMARSNERRLNGTQSKTEVNQTEPESRLTGVIAQTDVEDNEIKNEHRSDSTFVPEEHLKGEGEIRHNSGRRRRRRMSDSSEGTRDGGDEESKKPPSQASPSSKENLRLDVTSTKEESMISAQVSNKDNDRHEFKSHGSENTEDEPSTKPADSPIADSSGELPSIKTKIHYDRARECFGLQVAGIALVNSVKAAGGNKEAARRIAHLCAVKLEAGVSKEDTLAYRKTLYEQLNEQLKNNRPDAVAKALVNEAPPALVKAPPAEVQVHTDERAEPSITETPKIREQLSDTRVSTPCSANEPPSKESLVDSTASESRVPDDPKDEVTVVFEPGHVGMTLTGGEVTKVNAESQAQKVGVKIGWRMKAVNGEKCEHFAAEPFTSAHDGNSPYRVTFGIGKAPEIKEAGGSAAERVAEHSRRSEKLTARAGDESSEYEEVEYEIETESLPGNRNSGSKVERFKPSTAGQGTWTKGSSQAMQAKEPDAAQEEILRLRSILSQKEAENERLKLEREAALTVKEHTGAHASTSAESQNPAPKAPPSAIADHDHTTQNSHDGKVSMPQKSSNTITSSASTKKQESVAARTGVGGKQATSSEQPPGNSNDKVLRVLACSDISGKFEELELLLRNKKNEGEPVDLVLACGRVVGGGFERYIGESPERSFICPVFFVDAYAKTYIEEYERRSTNGNEAPLRCKGSNIYYLGSCGATALTSVSVPGLRVAYLAGTYSMHDYGSSWSPSRFEGTSYTANAIAKVKHQVSKLNHGEIDILLTSEWSTKFWSTSHEREMATPVEKTRSSPAVWDLFSSLKPRFHIFGGADRYLLRKSSQGPHEFVCTSLGLSPKQWYYSFSVRATNASIADLSKKENLEIVRQPSLAPGSKPRRPRQIGAKVVKETNRKPVQPPSTSTRTEKLSHASAHYERHEAHKNILSRAPSDSSPSKKRKLDRDIQKAQTVRQKQKNRAADFDWEVLASPPDEVPPDVEGLVVFDTQSKLQRKRSMDDGFSDVSALSPAKKKNTRPSRDEPVVRAMSQSESEIGDDDPSEFSLPTPPGARNLKEREVSPSPKFKERDVSPSAECSEDGGTEEAATEEAASGEELEEEEASQPHSPSMSSDGHSQSAESLAESLATQKIVPDVFAPAAASSRAIPRPSLELPPGWQTMWSTTNQRTYYLNALTGESTWVMPSSETDLAEKHVADDV